MCTGHLRVAIHCIHLLNYHELAKIVVEIITSEKNFKTQYQNRKNVYPFFMLTERHDAIRLKQIYPASLSRRTKHNEVMIHRSPVLSDWTTEAPGMATPLTSHPCTQVWPRLIWLPALIEIYSDRFRPASFGPPGHQYEAITTVWPFSLGPNLFIQLQLFIVSMYIRLMQVKSLTHRLLILKKPSPVNSGWSFDEEGIWV